MPEYLIRPSVFANLKTVTCGFTTRSFSPPDESREATRQRLLEMSGLNAVASVGQVHGADVATVIAGGHTPEHDGLVTDRANLLLTTVAADCALVLLADPASGVIGACHSGWRGTVAGILSNTITSMEALGADARGLYAYVAPCISSEQFEVGDEVAEQFAPEVVVRKPEWPRPHVDLKAELARQLLSHGVEERHTEIADSCTMTDTDRFYSYRAEGGTPGRMIGFIGRRV